MLGTFSARARREDKVQCGVCDCGRHALRAGRQLASAYRDVSQRPTHKKDTTRDSCCTLHLHHVLCSAHTYTRATTRRDPYNHSFIPSCIHTARNMPSVAQQNTARDARVRMVHMSEAQPRGPFLVRRVVSSLYPSFLVAPAATLFSPYASNNVFFARALASLPATVLEALKAAELADRGKGTDGFIGLPCPDVVPKVVRVVDVPRLDPKVAWEVPADEKGVGCQPYLGPRGRTPVGPQSGSDSSLPRLDPKVVRDPSTCQRVSETQHDTKAQSRKPSYFLVPYRSLVRDGVLPPGFGEAFSRLERPANLATDRQDITASRASDLRSGWIRDRNRQAAQLTKFEKTATDLFLHAADKAPRRFRAKFQQVLYQGPNGRKEAGERTKWIELLPGFDVGARPQRSNVEVKGEW